MSVINLFGSGGPPSSSASSASKGVSFSKNNDHRVIRGVDFKDPNLKAKVRNSAPFKAWHKIRLKKDGRMTTGVVKDIITKSKVISTHREGGERVVEKDYNNNILKVVQGAVKKGQTVSSWKNNITKNRRLESTAKDGDKITYHIGGNEANREKRKDLAEIFDSQGPTKEEQIAETKKVARFQKRNVFYINRERTEAEKLKDARGNARDKSDKGLSTDIGVKGEKYKTSVGGTVVSEDDFKGAKTSSALGAGYVGQDKGADAFSQGEGAASVAGGLGSKPQEEDNVIEGDFNKNQEPLDNNIMPRTGTDG